MVKAEPAGPERISYQGKMLEIVEQPMQMGDRSVTFEFARRAPGTRLIIPTADGEILLTKEYRGELGDYDFRLPGGKVFDSLIEYNSFLSSGADIKKKAYEAATKEALEEAGVQVKNMDMFALSRCGATIEWDLYYFVVRDYVLGEPKDSGEGEDIVLTPTSSKEARAMCLDGRIREDRSALILLRYLNA